jgi:hypothetical protein
MASIIPGYEYDIFISYRLKDNRHGGWVTEFVKNLMGELESTFKEDISIYFDENPHDGLLETHDINASLKQKLKCLVFIPIISHTYCDPKSFAWEYEFKSFIKLATNDKFGLRTTLPNGNVASRVLPIRIHDLDMLDIKLFESELGGAIRGVDFIYIEPGVNRPLTPADDEKGNLNLTRYRNQINKLSNAVKEIISGLKAEPVFKPLKGKSRQREPLEKSRNEKANASLNYDPEKTQIGLQADYIYDNKSNKNNKPFTEICPKCQYWLRTKPDIASPCPNCGYSGNQTKTVFDSSKTITIKSLNPELEILNEFKFRLIKEDDNSEIEIQSPDEQEVILNRSHLDAGNQTISDDQQVKIKYLNQKIYIEDVSSNDSSFIQAKSRMPIDNNTKLVIGNKIYLFNNNENLSKIDFSSTTRKFGNLRLDGIQPRSGCRLTDIGNGKIMNFNGENIFLTRTMLDPGNNSISSSHHTELEFSKGEWYVKDHSSNESTFIQVKSVRLLENKIRIILGNKIFRFEYI